jgi:Tol biopolymer transport system component
MRPSVRLPIAPILIAMVVLVATACAPTPIPSPASSAPETTSASTLAPATRAPATVAPGSPAPSPRPAVGDGEAWLVYQAWGDGGRTAIRLVRPDGSDDHPLLASAGPGVEQAHPAWSPDGAWVAFDAWFRQPDGPERIETWVARVDGTEARVVAACEAPCLQLAYPAWSPDGASIAVTRYDIRANGDWGPAAIEVVDVASGERRVVAVTADGRSAYYDLRWSPDGRRIALTLETYPDEAQASVDSSAVAVVAVGDVPREPVRITPDGMFAREPDWAPADRIVFAVGASDAAWATTASIATIAPDGSDMRRLTDAAAGDAPAWEPVWADEGRTIVFSTLTGAAQHVATIPATGGTPSVSTWSPPVPRNDPRRVHIHPRPGTDPVATDPMTPGAGEPWIAYQGGTGLVRIRLVRPDGTDDRGLGEPIDAGSRLHPDWSPDGMRIAFAADSDDGTRDLWIVDVDSSETRKVYDCVDPCAWSDDPAWSPDGRSILFQQAIGVGDGPDGTGVLAALDVATGTVTTVYEAPPRHYLFVPRWSPDGAAVVVEDVEFATPRLDGETVVAGTVAVLRLEAGKASGDPRPLVPRELGARYPDWHPDGSRIVFELPLAPGAAASDLWSVGVDGGNRTRLTTLADSGGRALQPTWSPDGTRLVFVAEARIGTPVAAISAADGSDVRLLPGSEVRTHPRLRPVP